MVRLISFPYIISNFLETVSIPTYIMYDTCKSHSPFLGQSLTTHDLSDRLLKGRKAHQNRQSYDGGWKETFFYKMFFIGTCKVNIKMFSLYIQYMTTNETADKTLTLIFF